MTERRITEQDARAFRAALQRRQLADMRMQLAEALLGWARSDQELAAMQQAALSQKYQLCAGDVIGEDNAITRADQPKASSKSEAQSNAASVGESIS